MGTWIVTGDDAKAAVTIRSTPGILSLQVSAQEPVRLSPAQAEQVRLGLAAAIAEARAGHG